MTLIVVSPERYQREFSTHGSAVSVLQALGNSITGCYDMQCSSWAAVLAADTWLIYLSRDMYCNSKDSVSALVGIVFPTI